MKKIIAIIIFILVMIFINREDEEIRVRIISNSNSEADLAIKEEIKEKVIIFLNKIEDNPSEYINQNINSLSEELNKIENCNVTFEKHIFMNKAYNDMRIDNGEYMTLLIRINEAKGDNWWTTLYPLNDLDPSTIKYKSWILERVEE